MEATVEQITAAITALNDKYWYVVMALLFVAGVWSVSYTHLRAHET